MFEVQMCASKAVHHISKLCGDSRSVICTITTRGNSKQRQVRKRPEERERAGQKRNEEERNV